MGVAPHLTYIYIQACFKGVAVYKICMTISSQPLPSNPSNIQAKGDLICWLAAIDIARACHNDDDLLQCVNHVVELSQHIPDTMLQRLSMSLERLVLAKNDRRVIEVEKKMDDLVAMLRQHIENI